MSWSEVLWVVLLTLTPTLELRASIPYAILGAGLHPAVAGALGIAANTALAPLVWLFLDQALHLFLRIGWFRRLWEWYAEKKRVKLKRYVERYGVLGLALFIGVPFPGTGVYSGAVAAFLVGYRFRDYLLASFLGCVLAGVVVTLVVASGSEALSLMYRH